jgi:polysaccharide biosynthesis transport protein
MSVALQPPRHANNNPLADAEPDLPALGAALWRKRWQILRPTILVALLTLGAVQLITPKYLSESRVIIEARDNIFLRPEADKDVMDRNAVDDEAVASQVQLVLSRDLAREVIDKLKLGERPEFDPVLRGVSPIKAVLGLLGIIKNPLRMTPEERVLEAYYERLNVYAVDKSRVIVIDFLSEDPELAARVANTIAEAYLVRQQAAKQDQARTAVEWLSGQIASLQKKVAEAEAKVETFRAKSNLLVGPNNTTLSAQQLGDSNGQLAAARAQKADAEAKAAMIRDMLNSGRPIDSSDILNSELIRRLSEQRVTLRAQLAEQSTTLLDGHPRIKELKAQIADLDKQIRAEADTVARSLENDAKLASARMDSLSASLNQLKSQAATSNEQDVELRALDRDAKSQRDLLESYLAKYREATARDTLNSSPADARVISRATVTNVPAYPKKLPTVLIATLATLVLCAGFVLTKELLDPPGPASLPVAAPAAVQAVSAGRLAVANEPVVAKGLKSRVAAFVNQRRHGAAIEPADAPLATIADVAQALLGGGGRSRVSVFGAVSGSDATGTAIKLARALAENARVVLVGLDPDDAEIKAISNDPSAGGLAELAGGSATFRTIITKDKQSRLHLISSGWAPTNRNAMLSAAGMVARFDALARTYDYLVVAAGAPVGANIAAIAEIAPHGILVTESPTSAATSAGRERLMNRGFGDVTVVVAPPAAARERAAA